MDLSKLTKFHQESVLLNANTQQRLNLTQVHDSPEFWHMFTVLNVDLEGRKVLRHIINFIFPNDLLPVYFVNKGDKAYFLARNCVPAITSICKHRFTIPNPRNGEKPYKIEINANVETTSNIKVVDIQQEILKVLQKRFVNGEMDLSNFCEDPELPEFCPLSQNKMMTYILHLVERFKPKKINLENNDLRTTEGLEKLVPLYITHLNLRNNNILNIANLRPLKKIKTLTHLWLDQNPFIKKIPDSFAYITVAKDMVGNALESLDGISISSGVQPTNKTFLCSEDAAHFTNQFLEYYFPMYDEDREKLADLYDPKTCRFSLSYSCQNRALRDEPEHFKFRNRNILIDRSDIFLYKEWTVISNIFSMLPKTIHYPQTFTTDVMHYDEKSALITVTGSFKEPSPHTRERSYSFIRTFMLKCIFRRTQGPEASAVWVITNDQLTVLYPSIIDVKDIKDEEKLTLLQILEQPLSKKNYAELEKTFELLTSLKSEFARAFLESTSYNLKKALETFVEMSKNDTISMSAFNNMGDPPKPATETKPIQPQPVLPVPQLAIPSLVPDTHTFRRPVDIPQGSYMNTSLNGGMPAGWPRPRQLVVPRSVTNAQNHPLLKK